MTRELSEIIAELQRRRAAWAALSSTSDGRDDGDEDEGEVLANEYDELLAFVTGERVAGDAEQLTETRALPLPPPASDELHHSADLGGYHEPDQLPDRRWRVRFYKEEMTVDRYSIIVAADSPAEARARVAAWGNGEIELTDDEAESEHYERQVDTRACEFSALEEEGDPYAAVEVDNVG
jgi:hypothetical protein